MSVARIVNDPDVDVDAIAASAAAIVAAANKHKAAVVAEQKKIIDDREVRNRNLQIARQVLDQRDADMLAPLNEEYGQLDSVTTILDPDTSKKDTDTVATSDDKASDKDKTVEIKKNDPPAADPSDVDDQPRQGRFARLKDDYRALKGWQRAFIWLFAILSGLTWIRFWIVQPVTNTALFTDLFGIRNNTWPDWFMTFALCGLIASFVGFILVKLFIWFNES